MKFKILYFFYFLAGICIMHNEQYWLSSKLVQYDKGGYYIYLPAVFIYKDVAHLGFSAKIDSVYHPNPDVRDYAIYTAPETGKRFSKYSLGVAIMEAPLFLVAHSYALITKKYPADGYSPPYQLSIAFSTILFSVLGLIFLKKFLSGLFPEQVVFYTLVLIAFGTNLYNYTMFDQGMSHTYSFFLFALMLYQTNLWYKNGRLKYIIGLGLTCGLIVITRPVNIIALVIPLLWSKENLTEKMKFWKTNCKGIALGITAFIAILMIQLCYWKFITNHWLYYSYVNEGFNFLHPYIFEGLFSYRKGWFIYTPIAFVAFFGFIPLWKKRPTLVLPLACFFVLIIYVVFSWNVWWYGGGFSCRPLIEALPVLAIPLAALIENIAAFKNRWLKGLSVFTFVFLLLLNIFQTYQYTLSILHPDAMNKAYYWRIFGKLEIDDNDKKLLDPR